MQALEWITVQLAPLYGKELYCHRGRVSQLEGSIMRWVELNWRILGFCDFPLKDADEKVQQFPVPDREFDYDFAVERQNHTTINALYVGGAGYGYH